jgi:hypothetical protein
MEEGRRRRDICAKSLPVTQKGLKPNSVKYSAGPEQVEEYKCSIKRDEEEEKKTVKDKIKGGEDEEETLSQIWALPNNM